MLNSHAVTTNCQLHVGKDPMLIPYHVLVYHVGKDHMLLNSQNWCCNDKLPVTCWQRSHVDTVPCTCLSCWQGLHVDIGQEVVRKMTTIVICTYNVNLESTLSCWQRSYNDNWQVFYFQMMPNNNLGNADKLHHRVLKTNVIQDSQGCTSI